MVKLKLEYFNKDYDAIYSSMLDKIKNSKDLKDKWTDFSEQDLGVVMLKVFSSMGDMLSFNMDNQVKECFLDTALRRENVARCARNLNYEMEPKKAGVVKVSVCMESIFANNALIPMYHKFFTSGTPQIFYNSKEDFLIPAGQCCVFDVYNQPSTGGQLDTDNPKNIALQEFKIKTTSDNAKVYLYVKYEGLNKIALFKRYPANATLDNAVTLNVRTCVQPTFVTGVSLSDPVGFDGLYNLTFIYNGGSGMTLQWGAGIPLVVDAGGTFTLSDSAGNSIKAFVTLLTLPVVDTADYSLGVSTVDTSDNQYKIAYGDDSILAKTVTLLQVNGTAITGSIKITANFNATAYKDLELWVSGPLCFEGTLVVDTFGSAGTANQKFLTSSAIQKIPTNATKTIQLSVNSSLWTETEDFFYLAENKFKVRTVNTSYAEIIFGDGTSGNVPTQGNIIVVYVAGNGSKGAVGSNKIINANSLISGASTINFQVNNIDASIGATDEETIEQTKAKAINENKTRGRAVTAGDYETLIVDYVETDKLSPKLVQAFKDVTEADLINELFIFVLSTDPATGRYISCNIDLTLNGGLYEYIDEIKTLPEGILTLAGASGINVGTMVDIVFYYNILVYKGFEAQIETLRENIAEAVKGYFHSLIFQQTCSISQLMSEVVAVEGVQAVGIYTSPTLQNVTTAAYDVTISGSGNKGKVLVLPEDFYTTIKKYIKFTTESTYA